MKLSFARGPLSPSVDGLEGISIALEHRSEHGELRKLELAGAYRIAVDEARSFGVVPLQKAIVIVGTSGLINTAFRMLGDAVALEDDERVTAGWITGYFGLDLLDQVGVPPYETAYVRAVLGHHVSNVVSLTAT